ncbi:glycosyltransferase [Blastococcus brunescens]|uniref:Nucleotide disphospho-sugar-binding domain-containing protein n=1 Tax=Blastococcus brunescens TaxID=1564165 RepID=A0ABZ1BAP1_9ACTN|nr:nucleotide disphospho-sugar-binding domain-containing protein [Blastococcus sp. BMG 8361]WRL66916.1 nucleotide disphospho-sugar-binding domain-containing protein [Blastococcus sp. BMG 8361]
MATAFRDAGHDIVVATGADGAAAAGSSGLDVRDIAPDVRIGAVFVPRVLLHPLQARREARGAEREPRFVGVLFAALAARMAGGVLALADEWQPDLVVQEPLAAAGSMAAARHRVPVVLVNNTFFDAEQLLAVTTAHLGGTARRYGVARIPPPTEVLLTAPRSLVGEQHGTPMRFVPVAGNGSAPDDLTRPGDRPRIIVGRSTVADPRPDRLMSSVVAAAQGLDVEVVLARPDRRVSRRPLPPNVRTTQWLPFPAVFPAASGVVHHGGAGTLLTGLACGVPQLVVPGAGDRRVNAELLSARGAGLAVPAERISAADVDRLVSDPGLATAAREVAEEIAAMPAPADVVEGLTALAR